MESPQLTAPEVALEDARRAAGNATSGARPDPEVVATAQRRQFTSSDKRRILDAADRCTQPGEIGALLRKEGIYSSQLATWRKQRAADQRAALAPQKRGRKADSAQAEDRRVRQLTQENERLRRRLAQANAIIDVQKKLCVLFGLPADEAERVQLMQALNQLAPEVGLAPACAALNLNRSSVYREDARRRLLTPVPVTRVPRPSAPLAFSTNERQQMLAVLNSERFADCSPYFVYVTLLDEGRYIGSVRTLYRALEADGQSAERRRQRMHPVYTKPELLATAPNQVWSWDITKLKGPAKWTCFHLYVILDIFSRYVVGWMVAPRETAELAEQLIAETVTKHNIPPHTLTLHADRGSSMRSKPVAALLVDLDVAKTHSRPYVSDDNPYSEAQFKTLKYRPDFPVRFGCIEDARSHCQRFFPWYNQSHCHSGIGYMTPATVHFDQAATVYQARAKTLEIAFLANPKRFKGKCPLPPSLPNAVWINPPINTKENLDS
ncbi:IS3 family transposase [Methylotuvimicrobium buryatense]|uniref:IS3 family transposase n=1 Tax=Methylotuvimicrobium buryatense TaxID=95641 RepID=UPI00399D69C4